MNNIYNLVFRKNVFTGITCGLVGSVYGNYKGIISYNNYVQIKKEVHSDKELDKIFDFKIISHTLFYGSTFGIVGMYPLISMPIVLFGFIYDKITY